MAHQQRIGLGSGSERVGHLVPVSGEGVEAVEHLSTLEARQQSFLRSSFNRTDDLRAGPDPCDGLSVFREPLAH